MTPWKKVHGSQPEQPSEWDVVSSAVKVYQRKNVHQIEVDNADGTTTTNWEYDERTMSFQEFQQEFVDKANSRIDEQQEQLLNTQAALVELFESLGGETQ